MLTMNTEFINVAMVVAYNNKPNIRICLKTEVIQEDTMEKHGIIKHGKEKVKTTNEIEPVHGLTYCRRKANKMRHSNKGKFKLDDMSFNDKSDDKISSPKSKSRRHLRKEIERLMEENHMLMMKLEDFNAITDDREEQKDKDKLIFKIRDKYHKLAQEYERVQQECEELNVLLKQKETEYRQLHVHHEESTQVYQQLEKTKDSLLNLNQKLKSDNIQLKEDIVLLKKVIYQLNVELERYQDKLRSCGQIIPLQYSTGTMNDAELSKENKKMLESWGNVDLHVLGPLLNAYQENIIEKKELISKYERELNDFTGRCKEIISENEYLQKELENSKSKCNRYEEEIKEISNDATLIKEQNDKVTQQVVNHKQKLQELQSLYERKIESLTQENKSLHKEVITYKTELSNLQGKYKIVNEGYEMLKNNSDKTMPVHVHVAAVDECKRLFEELKSQYESEKKKLSTRIKQLEESLPDNEKQLVTVTAERNHLKNLTRTLERNLKRTQHKLTNVQNVVYSVQISRDSFKRQLNKTTAYCEKLVSEYEKVMSEKEKLMNLLHEREKENADIQYIGDSIAHRVGNLKSQLNAVQKDAKDQLAMVERHIRIHEVGTNQLKSEYRQEVQRLKRLLKQKDDVITQLQKEKEKLTSQENIELV
ncbi:centrosomal protein of 89 kDa-like [Vespa mandarinia]|uniref:centrosomal protein of 89 kDa-like n=1 Tax=Vespa mandarinia TaxID=7446 RepID=UPI00161F5F92|nr:centrosomal protein of 89 kDa-like [Vespa mandarinia]